MSDSSHVYTQAMASCSATSLIGQGVVTKAAIELIWQGYAIAAAGKSTEDPSANVSAVGIQALNSQAGATLSAASIATIRKAVALTTGLKSTPNLSCASITVHGLALDALLAVFAQRIFAMYELGDMRVVDIAEELVAAGAGKGRLIESLLVSTCSGSKLAPSPANMRAWIAQSAAAAGPPATNGAADPAATHLHFMLKVAFNNANPPGLQARAAAETLIGGSIVSALQASLHELSAVANDVDEFRYKHLNKYLQAASTAEYVEKLGEGALCQLAVEERKLHRRYADAVAMLLVNPLSEAPAIAGCALLTPDVQNSAGYERKTAAMLKALVSWERVAADYGTPPAKKKSHKRNPVWHMLDAYLRSLEPRRKEVWKTQWQPIIETELLSIGPSELNLLGGKEKTYGALASQSAALVLPSMAHAIATIPAIIKKIGALPANTTNVKFAGISAADAVAAATVSTYWDMQGLPGLDAVRSNSMVLYGAFSYLLSVMPGSPNLTPPNAIAVEKNLAAQSRVTGVTWRSNTSAVGRTAGFSAYGGDRQWGYVPLPLRGAKPGKPQAPGLTASQNSSMRQLSQGVAMGSVIPPGSLRMGPCIAFQVFETKKTRAPWEGVPLCAAAQTPAYYTPWNTAAEFAEILQIAGGGATPYYNSNVVSIAPACALGLNQCPIVIARAFADGNMQTAVQGAYSAQRAFESINVAQWMVNTDVAGGLNSGGTSTTAGTPQAMWALIVKMNSRAAGVIAQAEYERVPDVSHLLAPPFPAGAGYAWNLLWGGLIFFLVLLLAAFARVALGVSTNRTLVREPPARNAHAHRASLGLHALLSSV